MKGQKAIIRLERLNYNTLIKSKSKIIIIYLMLLAPSITKAQNNNIINQNNKELISLEKKAKERLNSNQKQLSPYDKESIGIALNPMMPNCQDISKSATIDKGYLRILYAFNALDASKPETYDDLQCLDIGKHTTKYSSLFVFEADSFATKDMLDFNRVTNMKIALDQVSINMSIRGKHQGWSRNLCAEIYKDLDKNELIEYCRMPDGLSSYNSYYTELIPSQIWSIENTTQQVSGYECQKATCSFRGRNYIAWFSPDIPVGLGPWKFSGLPGLILKVYDTDSLFVYECVGLEQFAQDQLYPIKKCDFYKNYKKTTRMELNKLLKRISENYYQVSGYTNVINKRLRKYNPIEKE